MIDEKKLNSPRPDFYRENWYDLNGEWEFSFDDEDRGRKEAWFQGHSFDKTIQVPFCYQSKLSRIHDTARHPYIWYQKKIVLPEGMEGKRIWLNFGAVDYKAMVWVNGNYAGGHKGGHTSFAFEITPYINKEATITVFCEDAYDIAQPRGKQHWNEKTDRCWYTATSGIWQSVWLEATQSTKIERILITPDIDKKQVEVKAKLSEAVTEGVLEWKVRFEGALVKEGSVRADSQNIRFCISIENPDPIDNLIRLWSPEHPDLYDLELTLREGELLCDEVGSYFGMRKIECCKEHILLNHFPLYQRLVLDQGYWEESLITPPDVQALVKDLTLVKEMGFNGVRKHQKIEVPAFLYLADCMGILVWEEMPSNYEFTEDGMAALKLEYEEMILRDYNHPCIITWVPLNESWGVRDILWDKKQQNFALSLYYATKAIDSSRIVSTNDGWESVTSDILGVHDYESDGSVLYEKYRDKEKIFSWTAVGKMIYAEGFSYRGEPVIMSEFGGVAFEDGENENWGYNEKASDENEFIERVSKLCRAIEKLDYMEGYCYTQLTDVEQETNGLLYSDRRPKVPIDRIRRMILAESIR
ncbi:MAG TPA: glycoside hydrolase family 2 [Clostridiales bacterium]|nr:glycoside hydrolase family 2 [Clostridiales bacterium]